MNFILCKYQLENSEYVKKYLDYKLKWRKSRKHPTFYINISRIYSYHPLLVLEIIQNIPHLGYYKDYFHILLFSKNIELNNQIHLLVLNQLKKDIGNMTLLWPISTLGKWLPSEKSKINKETNFIDLFSKLLYPDIKSDTFRKKKYRQLKTNINKYLGTLESNICTGNYNKINLDNISNTSVIKSVDTLRKNIGDEKVDRYLINYLSKLTLNKFIKVIIKQYPKKYTHDVINLVWNKNLFQNEVNLIKKHLPTTDHTFILDLSKSTFEGNYLLLFGMFLLIKREYPSSKFMINLTEYIFNDNLIDNITNFMENIGYWTINDLSICEKENIVIISNNQFENYKSINTNLIGFVHHIIRKSHVCKITNNHISYFHIYTIIVLFILYIVVIGYGWVVSY